MQNWEHISSPRNLETYIFCLAVVTSKIIHLLLRFYTPLVLFHLDQEHCLFSLDQLCFEPRLLGKNSSNQLVLFSTRKWGWPGGRLRRTLIKGPESERKPNEFQRLQTNF